MIVYHNSPHLFDFPVYELIVQNRTNHGNGELGLWFATSNSWQEGFGSYCYEVTLKEDTKIIHIDASEFAKMCYDESHPTYYQEWRLDYMSKGHHVICLKERYDTVDMGIILDFGCIACFERLSP